MYYLNINFQQNNNYSIYQKRDTKIEQTPGPNDDENVKEKKVGITINQKVQDKGPGELLETGAYQKKSHILEVIKFIFINWNLIFK